ncbi:MAG: DUF1595 domain-containing protein, partial [Planctomycetaceae bacterium]
MPTTPDQALSCATQIFQPLLRQAYRRPVSEDDLAMPLRLFHEASAGGQDFEAGIERGLAGILASPHFLFKLEQHVAENPAS